MNAKTLPLLDILCADKEGARMALEAAGCSVVPALQQAIDHPMIGTIHRMFGVMRNLVDRSATPTQQVGAAQLAALRTAVGSTVDAEALEGGRRLTERVLHVLEDPDNEKLTAKLHSGALRYMPSNKAIATRVRRIVGLRGAHLPWSFQALNLGLSMKVQKHCSGYGFVVFYSEDAKFDRASPPGIRVGRIFSTPFGVEGFATWQEPIRQDILDEDVGLILEANWLGLP